MSIPPLCKCQKCGSACLWISTLCSNCIREIEDEMKLEESAANLEWAKAYDEKRRMEREESEPVVEVDPMLHVRPYIRLAQLEIKPYTAKRDAETIEFVRKSLEEKGIDWRKKL